jgi:hypothetical protein
MASPFKALALCAALAVALPAVAAEDWKILKRDDQAMLSIDTKSIVTERGVVSLRYLVDFRQPQGQITEGSQYRSIVVSAKIRCKEKTISLGHTDAYFAWGAAGNIVAKTAPTRGEAQFHPLEKGSSDLELWTHVCDQPVKLLPPPAPRPQPPAPPKK